MLDACLLGADELRIGLIEQALNHRRLGEILLELGFISEGPLVDTLAEQFGIPRIHLGSTLVMPEALAWIPGNTARRCRVMPVSLEGNRLTLAMADIRDHGSIEQLRRLLPEHLEVDIGLAGSAEIEQAIDQHYGHALEIDSLLTEIEHPAPDNQASRTVVALVDALLADAVRKHASDIHLEPEAASLRIRYRIDGLLHAVRILHKRCWPQLCGRVKVMAGMNIAETRMPQDGHFTRNIGGRPIDFRTASQPTIHGENIVLRLLDRQKGIVPLDGLGLDPAATTLLERMIHRPEGLLLVTGPTGSGKTTTLYSLLGQINGEHLHIMTLEDPVEYPLPLLRQTSLAEGLKLDFASGVRSMLRQDPDVILIGEIRDSDTAAMALRAALTGHQVFATLHAASALTALVRLRELGVGADLLHGNLIGIVAQRLVRRLCPACRQERLSSPAERQLLGSERHWAAAGCSLCHHRGYHGRLALMEILRIDPELDARIASQEPLHALLAHARQKGFQTLLECGLARVRDGDTSLAELARVVDLGEAW